ncbi:hypothetical protein IJ135_02035 [Candidatus Saccharibacteria bacterium]|nr:hypothetical protein [Candidatus Saccharibacteria bacterium]
MAAELNLKYDKEGAYIDTLVEARKYLGQETFETASSFVKFDEATGVNFVLPKKIRISEGGDAEDNIEWLENTEALEIINSMGFVTPDAVSVNYGALFGSYWESADGRRSFFAPTRKPTEVTHVLLTIGMVDDEEACLPSFDDVPGVEYSAYEESDGIYKNVYWVVPVGYQCSKWDADVDSHFGLQPGEAEEKGYSIDPNPLYMAKYVALHLVPDYASTAALVE